MTITKFVAVKLFIMIMFMVIKLIATLHAAQQHENTGQSLYTLRN